MILGDDMSRVVIYSSKTGFTEKYAKWLGEELTCPIFSLKEFSQEGFKLYDSIIYAGGLYAIGINGLDKVLKQFKNYKNLTILAVGLTPPKYEDIKKVIENNFDEFQQKYIKFFYVRGGFDYNKLGKLDKILMTLMKWKISLKRKKTANENGMLAAYEKPLDFTDKNHLKEIIRFLKNNN